MCQIIFFFSWNDQCTFDIFYFFLYFFISSDFNEYCLNTIVNLTRSGEIVMLAKEMSKSTAKSERPIVLIDLILVS